MPSQEPYLLFNRGKSFYAFYLIDADQALDDVMSKPSADVIVTSPPYNIGKNYSVYSDRLPRERYLEWLSRIFTRARDVLSDTGSLFLNIGTKPSDPWLSTDVANALRNDYHLQNVIHWIKSVSIDHITDGNSSVDTVGHVKPIKSARFLNDVHEYIFHFTKSGKVPLEKLSIGVPYKDKSNISRWKSVTGDMRDRGNVWYLPYETIQSRKDRPHPASFPPKLPEFCIKLHGVSKTSLVLDPFCGIGNTAVACTRLGTSFIGFDIDASYLDEAGKRVELELESAPAGEVSKHA
jgi:site-specific DNA-methyltransferase (adenine-specific)